MKGLPCFGVLVLREWEVSYPGELRQRALASLQEVMRSYKDQRIFHKEYGAAASGMRPRQMESAELWTHALVLGNLLHWSRHEASSSVIETSPARAGHGLSPGRKVEREIDVLVIALYTGDPLVRARGRRISKVAELPLVVSDGLESLTKTKAAVQALQKLGCGDELQKIMDSKKIRAGKGKARNRRYVRRLGPLVIYNEDNGITKAMRNIPGVETAHVDRLNLLRLAPGGSFGRFIIWTESAFKRLSEIYGTAKGGAPMKKGYHLPRASMQNADLANALKKKALMEELNPGAAERKAAVFLRCETQAGDSCGLDARIFKTHRPRTGTALTVNASRYTLPTRVHFSGMGPVFVQAGEVPEICKCEDRPSLLGFSLDGQNVEAPVMMHEELCQDLSPNAIECSVGHLRDPCAVNGSAVLHQWAVHLHVLVSLLGACTEPGIRSVVRSIQPKLQTDHTSTWATGTSHPKFDRDAAIFEKEHGFPPIIPGCVVPLLEVHHDEDPEDVEGSFLGDEPQVQQYDLLFLLAALAVPWARDLHCAATGHELARGNSDRPTEDEMDDTAGGLKLKSKPSVRQGCPMSIKYSLSSACRRAADAVKRQRPFTAIGIKRKPVSMFEINTGSEIYGLVEAADSRDWRDWQAEDDRYEAPKPVLHDQPQM
ncbi:60S ribosomal protein L4-1 [Symbiodinium microadriaticum]|uniref:60S ribosomal protein L4-1 n=1 Tax=Symbiodinium microadriaticum TaxID=2951 RepID=A0A1Q9DMU1_SYMMI|nr:60S ribosomal protein L4-1 [Symbiodinium microadriaticum]